MSATKWLDSTTAPFPPQLTEFALALSNLQANAIEIAKGGGSETPPVEDENAAFTQPTIPETLAILPLRGVVVYPVTAVPLTVGQPRSVRLIDDAATGQRIIGLVTAKDPEQETPGPDELYSVGTAAIVHRLFRVPDGTIRLLVQGLARFRVEEFVTTEPYLKARVTPIPETSEENLEVEALQRKVSDQFQKIGELVPSIPAELLSATLGIEDPRQFAYTIATYQRMDLEDAQQLLALDSVKEKLRRLMTLLGKEIEVLELGRKIQSEAQTEMEKVQREYFLREQLKAIQRELGEADEQTVEIEEFRQKIAAAGLTEEAQREANRELDRLAKLPTAAAEYGVIRTYLDWLVSLPWSKITADNLDIAHARQVLNEDHYGLPDIKDRIVEFLAVRKLRQERKPPPAKNGKEGKNGKNGQVPSPEPAPVDLIRREREGVILCFVGPPGVGKTSLGQSIARALGRKFVRLSLGGVRDEAEIRGHRRTYIGALPGRLIQSLRRLESRNPVFMLDEVDKLGMDYRGDPSSALLEVLDPEQNREFRDHYLDVAFDLSQVMFITTANQLDPIPGPLRDRMEILRLSGYTEGEKLAIATQYLIPRQIKENGLRPAEISFSQDALQAIIRQHTREAGVRNLERQIGAICRKVATRLTEGKLKRAKVNPAVVTEYLGKPEYFYTEEIEERTAVPGVATALAYTSVGGDIMFIEATAMPGGRGFQITGQLGDVMQESARAALSFVRANAKRWHIDAEFFAKHDLHVHVPAGATPKDGPSAGITIATALVSLAVGHPVRPEVGMTGEITLRGQVLPIGGVKEKVLAAHRAGLKTVLLPKRNEKDLEDVPAEVQKVMRFVFVTRMEEVLAAAIVWPKARKTKPAKAKTPKAPKAPQPAARATARRKKTN